MSVTFFSLVYSVIGISSFADKKNSPKHTEY